MDRLTITELTRRIKLLLEDALPTVWVEGELSNFTHHTSGHMYFTLKDENCQIKGVMWREQAARLGFTPRDGLKVLVRGVVTVYERGGQYQLRVEQLQPVGKGDLQMAFEQLKETLHREGLFEEVHKNPLPTYPQRIGIITSPTGAALQDILNVSSRRFPGIRLFLYPVRVQGDEAAGEIAGAIEALNEYGRVDVLIVGRGGGSLEDLWAFNEEIVARAIFNSTIPVVSAVGHEIDFTISDFVADLRAPTPSAAAEMVIPDRQELVRHVALLTARSRDSLERSIRRYEDRLSALTSSYGLRHLLDLLHQFEQRRDELLNTLRVHLVHFLRRTEDRISLHRGKLENLNPHAVLKRGYSICRVFPLQEIVREAKTLRSGDEIDVVFHRGYIRGVVRSVVEE